MARKKTPQEKKRESYLKDRRNTYGESSKSSRKNIRRSRQIGNQATRRLARQAVAVAAAAGEPERADAAEARAKLKRRKGWRKWADEPLGAVVQAKLERRARFGIIAPEEAETKSRRIRRRTSR